MYCDGLEEKRAHFTQARQPQPFAMRVIGLLSLLCLDNLQPALATSNLPLRAEQLLTVANERGRLALNPLLLNCSTLRRARNINNSRQRRRSCDSAQMIEAPAWLKGTHAYLLYYSTGLQVRALGSPQSYGSAWEELGAVLNLESVRKQQKRSAVANRLGRARVRVDARHSRLVMAVETLAGDCDLPLTTNKNCARGTVEFESGDGEKFLPSRSAGVELLQLQTFEHGRHEYALMSRSAHRSNSGAHGDGLALSRRALGAGDSWHASPGFLVPGARDGTIIARGMGEPLFVIWSAHVAVQDQTLAWRRMDETLRPGARGAERLYIAQVLDSKRWQDWSIGTPQMLIAPADARALPLRSPSATEVGSGEWLLTYTLGGEAVALAQLHFDVRVDGGSRPTTRTIGEARDDGTLEWQPPHDHAAAAQLAIPNGSDGGGGALSLPALAQPITVVGSSKCDIALRARKYAPECGEAGRGDAPPRPMLVASFGRSGTSFLRKVLLESGIEVDHDAVADTKCGKLMRSGQPYSPDECLAPVGAVSWPHAFALDKWCSSNTPAWIWRRRGRRLLQGVTGVSDARRFNHVFHLVRNPLSVIISRFDGGRFRPHEQHPRLHASLIDCLTAAQPHRAGANGSEASSRSPRPAVALRFTLRSWVLWHSFIEASSEWRMRAEDVRGSLIVKLLRSAEWLGAPGAAASAKYVEEAFQQRIEQIGNSTNHGHTKHTEGITWHSLEEADAIYYAMAVQMAVRYGYGTTLPAREAALAAAMDGVAFQRCGFVGGRRKAAHNVQPPAPKWSCWLSPTAPPPAVSA
jgi:hypothetical protein